MKSNTTKDPIGYQRKSVHADVDHIAHNMRKADLAELKAQYPTAGPREVLLLGLNQSVPSRTMVRTYKKQEPTPVGMWGVVPGDGFGLVWMLGTDELVEGVCARKFVRECRKELPHLLDEYPLLTNVVDARNEVHLRFIEWMHFDIGKEAHTINGLPFYRFWLTKEIYEKNKRK